MSTIRDERDLSDLWTETPQKRKEKQEAKKRKQERVSKEMLRRVVEFNEARQNPTKRVGENRPKQDIRVVDVGDRSRRGGVETDGEVSIRTFVTLGTGEYRAPERPSAERSTKK